MPPTTFAPDTADFRSRLDREVSAAVKPLGEVLSLSREASGAMRAELERLEARFREIKAEAGEFHAQRAAPGEGDAVAAGLHEACERAGALEQRLAEAAGEAGARVEDLEARAGRLMRSCDEVAAKHEDLARAGEQRRCEMERISEMPLARIEAAADAAAARLESLIEQASEAAGRFEHAAREHAVGELTLREATERLAPWEGVLDGSRPGPVEDLSSAMRVELRQEMTSLGAGLAQLAEAVVKLAQARGGGGRPSRKPSKKINAPAKRASPGKAAQQVEAKPGRSGPSGRAATSMKSVVRGGRRKASRGSAGRRNAAGSARSKAARSSKAAPRCTPKARSKPAARRGAARKAAAGRR